MPAFKPNPGCTVPNVKQPPDVKKFLDALAKSYAKLVTENPLSRAADRATKEIERMKKRISTQERVWRSQVEKILAYAELGDKRCPLPQVVDKDAVQKP